MGDGEREMDVLSYPFIPSFFLLPNLPRTQSSPACHMIFLSAFGLQPAGSRSASNRRARTGGWKPAFFLERLMKAPLVAL